MKFMCKTIQLIFLMLLAGCSASEDSKNLLSDIGDLTCKTVDIYSNDTVAVNFSIPDEAIMFRITQDGTSIFQTDDKSVTQKIEGGLVPGQTYRFRCEVLLDVNLGYQTVGKELKVTLPISTPPTFAGLKNVTLSGSDVALLEWDRTEDSILSHYKVFKYLGVTSDVNDFPASPLLTITDLSKISEVVANLGDEITYSFRVTACNSADICDNNSQILNVTTPDTGAPTTTGATGLSLTNGTVSLAVPWTDQNGNVSKRSIYRAVTATGTACPLVFGLYSNVNDIIVTEPKNTPLSIDAAGVLNEGQKYCFVVRDTDPSNNTETNFNIQSVEVGDITVPNFTAPINLVRDSSNVEDGVVATWTAMARELDDSLGGAHEYLVYLSSSVAPALPDANPCLTGVLYETISSVAYPQGATVTSTISGLNSRNWHRVCVKAKDSSSNEATQDPAALASTGDITAPAFSGVQSINYTGAVIEVLFIIPQDLDTSSYKITTVRTRSGVVNTAIVVTKNLSGLTPGVTYTSSFTLAEADLIDGDTVAVKVDACDDAFSDFNTINNCSATSAEQVLILPDITPPQGFAGITVAAVGTIGNGSVSISWSNPGSLIDYAGFKVSYVDPITSQLVDMNSINCVCAAQDCQSSPITSCEVSQDNLGATLAASKQYEFYVSAYDLVGNSTEQYIAHTGGSKVTSVARAQDITAPAFNADFLTDVVGGNLEVSFSKATDNQYAGTPDNLDIQYQIYRKENTTILFTCGGGDPKDPSCDGGVSLLTTVAGLSLTEVGGKLVYPDSAILDGKTYFYQTCALDFANNRTCQTGAIAQHTVTDTTIPEISNFITDKTFSGGVSTINFTFNISDNQALYSELVVKVYRSAVAYPSQGSPGVPIYQTGAGVSVDAGTGVTTFTDTGTMAGVEYYYLAEVRDLAGLKGYLEFRDLLPGPVITSVTFNGGEVPQSSIDNPTQPQKQNLRIVGENLTTTTSIDILHSSGTGTASCTDQGNWTVTATEITCQTEVPAKFGTFDLTLTVADGQMAVANGAFTLTDHCTSFPSLTSLEGAGTSADPYAICFPEHLNLIGAGETYTGYFRLMRNMDIAIDSPGFIFAGVPPSTPVQFTLHGNDFEIKNLSIEHTIAVNGAGFLQQCLGSSLTPDPVLQKITFKDSSMSALDESIDNVGFLIGFLDCAILGENKIIFDVTFDGINLTSGADNVGIVVGRVAEPDVVVDAVNLNNVSIYIEAPIATLKNNTGIIAGTTVGGGTVIRNSQISTAHIYDDADGAGMRYVGAGVGLISSQTTLDNNTVSDFFIHRRSVNTDAIYTGGLVGMVNRGAPNTVVSNNTVEVTFESLTGTGQNFASTGGLIGIVNSRNSGLVTVIDNSVDMQFTGNLADTRIGGLIGEIGSVGIDIEGNSITATLDGVSSSSGGIIGYWYLRDSGYTMNLKDNYANVTISSVSSTGGFFRSLSFAGSSADMVITVENNYVVSTLSSSGGTADPVMPIHSDVGTNNTISFINNYYDNTVNSTSIMDLAGEFEGKTSVELQSPATFVGWDFATIWNDRSALSLPPNLQWEP